MLHELFAQALGIPDPWFVENVEFDKDQGKLSIRVDFRRGARFAHQNHDGLHPVHDTKTKRFRHLNFFQFECELVARVPRVRLPNGKVALVSPPWAGKLSGFSLLFEALILAMCQDMTFAAVARLAGLSQHQTQAISNRYVELATETDDQADVRAVAIDETSRARGHNYVTVVADARKRRVIFVGEGRAADSVDRFARSLEAHGGDPEAVEVASIDMSPAYMKGVAEHLPNAQITFDKFHVIAHASKALDQTRRIEQRANPQLKGMRWALLKNPERLGPEQRAQLNALIAQAPGKRTARAWMYREQLRNILNRKQVNVVRAMLRQWCANVNRSKVEPMKAVARMIRKHLEGIVAWARTRQTNGFIEALNGLFQAAKRKARGYGTFQTIRTVFFLIAGKLDFSKLNPHVAYPLGI